MIENIDNVLARVKEIQTRMREIQSMVNKGRTANRQPSRTTDRASRAADIPKNSTASVPSANTQKSSTVPSGIVSGFNKTSSSNKTSSFSELVKQASASIGNADSSSATSPAFEGMITEVGSHLGVDSDLIKAVIKQESGFNPTAVSNKGAQGLMQLMPSTAESLGVNDSFNPLENIYGGTRYLKQMLERYNGDLSLALAAYNAGPGRVDEADGIPAISETQNYVSNVLNNFQEYKDR